MEKIPHSLTTEQKMENLAFLIKQKSEKIERLQKEVENLQRKYSELETKNSKTPLEQ